MQDRFTQHLHTILSKASKTPRILFSEIHDERIRQAAWQLQHQGLILPVFVSNERSCYKECKHIETIAVSEDVHFDACVQHLFEKRKHKGVDLDTAHSLAQNPLIYSYLLVDLNLANGSVNGAATSTAEVVRGALQIIGTKNKGDSVSSFFVMLPNAPNTSEYIFADCALIIDPSAHELAQIASASISSARSLIAEEPRVAMLSFSTAGSAQHPKVDKVREATEQLKQLHPDIAIDGDIQFDAAIIPAVNKIKAPQSTTNGQANILIFPDLNAGNIGYKIAQRLGKMTAIGPILQGLRKPVNDLSRGCSVQDICYTALITASQALR